MFMSISNQYPEEFKIEGVKQLTENSHNVAEAATYLGKITHRLWLDQTL